MRSPARKLTATAAAALAAATPASAFYFLGWPGDGVPRVPSLVAPSPVLGTPVPVPGGTVDRISVPPAEFAPPGPGELTPPAVPEPGTVVLAGVGLAAVGVRKWRKG